MFHLVGCGGGGGETSTSSTTPNVKTSSAVTYTFIPPVNGETLTYVETLIDNLSNTINRTIIQQTTAVNADGSYVDKVYDPLGNKYVTGTVNHTFYPETINYSKSGNSINWIIELDTGVSEECTNTFGTLYGNVSNPIESGQSWSQAFTTTCTVSPNGNGIKSPAPTTYSNIGTFVGTETITVPYGTFLAYKFEHTISWLNLSGTTTTRKSTNWHNTIDTRILKSESSYTYSGTSPPQGSLVTYTRVLQSQK